MIKPVKEEDTPFGKANSKLNLFYKDLKEIIDKKIEYSEFVNFCYSDSTAVSDLSYKAQRYCSSVLYKKTGKWLENVCFFIFSKSTKDNKTHFYAKFDIEEWEKALEYCKEKSKVENGERSVD